MTDDRPSFLATRRAGERPQTTPTNPHTQLTQLAPPALQESVFEHARALAGVKVGPSRVSVPGARAFHLPESPAQRRDAFLIEHEFAHLHPSRDGSLHLVLAPAIVDEVIANGWAEYHPVAGKHGMPANIVMVYGPRDDAELAIVKDLVSASHVWANA
jgi:Family of unknown function (DUF5519)